MTEHAYLPDCPGAYWDAIGIGTSPLMLLRAAALARSGHRVLLVDRGSGPGGSWRAARAFGRENVELGVHLIENRREVAEILSDAAQIPLRRDPPDLNSAIVRGRRVHFGASRVLLHGGVAAKALLGGNRDKARRMSLSAWRALRCVSSCFFYPEGGMQAVIAALLGQVRAGGGAALFGTEVLKVAPGPCGARVQLQDRVLDCRFVMFASRAHSPVALPGSPPLEIDVSFVRSAVLHFAGNWCRPTGYVETIGHPFLKRVRDVGSIARPLAPSPGGPADGIACVQLRAPGPADDRILAAWLTAQLKQLGLLDCDARPLGVIRSDVRLATATNASLHRLQARASWIHVIPSTDLAEELLNGRWRGEVQPSCAADTVAAPSGGLLLRPSGGYAGAALLPTTGRPGATAQFAVARPAAAAN